MTRPAVLLNLFLLAFFSGPLHLAAEEHFWIGHPEHHEPHAAVEHDSSPMTRWTAEFEVDQCAEAVEPRLAPRVRESRLDLRTPAPAPSPPPDPHSSRAPPAR